MTTLPEKQFKAINLIEDLLKQLKRDLGQTNKEKHKYNKTYKQDDKEKRKNFFQRFQFTSIRPQKRPQCHTEHKTQVFSGRNLITATSNFIHHYQLTNNNEHIDINKKNNKTNPHHTPSHPHCSNEKNRKDSFFTRHGNSDDRIRATKVHSFIPSHLTNTPPPSSSSPYHTLHVTFISPPSFYPLHLTTILSPPPSHHHPFTPPPPHHPAFFPSLDFGAGELTPPQTPLPPHPRLPLNLLPGFHISKCCLPHSAFHIFIS